MPVLFSSSLFALSETGWAFIRGIYYIRKPILADYKSCLVEIFFTSTSRPCGPDGEIVPKETM
jgi:hypothetical protein